MNNYLRLLTRITNTPLLISESKLSIITDNVLIHLANQTQYSTTYENSAQEFKRQQTEKILSVGSTDVKHIAVYDTLQARGGFGGLSGFTSYSSIKANIENAITQGYSNIVLLIDSLGGEPTGLFELTHYIREQVAAGINIFSYIDGAATSAAYAIAAATKTRYVTEISIVGSIAAILVHLELSKADEESGKKYTIKRSKSEKALADSHTPLSDIASEKLDNMLANADTIFNNDVLLSMPKLSLQNIIDMKGSEFIASEALQLGLVDHIVTGVDSALKLALPISTAKPITNVKLKSKEVKMNIEELTLALEAANGEIAVLKANLAVAATTQAAAITAERERVVAILEASQTLKVGLTTVMGHITKGYDKDASLEIQTAIAEALGATMNLQGAGNQGAPNPDDVSETRLAELKAGLKSSGLTLRGTN